MASANGISERELIQQQLTDARETLERLRKIGNGTLGSETGEMNLLSTSTPHNNDFLTERNDIRGSYSPQRTSPRRSPQSISTTARDNLVQALGLQVSKLEDDLKVSLLSYFEQVEKQKEDLIESFNVMQQQLTRHQQMCQQQSKEMEDKEQTIRDLETSRSDLEEEVQRLKDLSFYESLYARSPNGMETLDETFPELNFSPSPGRDGNKYMGIENGKADVSEKLLQENERLRELLRQYEGNDYSRLERKMNLQEKLCHSYDKDISSKDRLIKRLQAENRGLQSDVQSLQDEILRVNASRLSAEQDKAKLHQEMQFSEEQIFTLREKFAHLCDENEYLSKTVSDANIQSQNAEDEQARLQETIEQLQRKCETYKDKLNDKEKHIDSVKKDNQGMDQAMEAMKKELVATRSEMQRLKREHERLQRENAEREIDRLTTEGVTKANNSKINQLKEQVAGSTQKMDELKRKCYELEKREAEMSQEAFASLEKYTRAEQELYLAKKELAQIRGFSDSAEKRRKEAEAELEGARKRLNALERELRGSRERRGVDGDRDAKIESLGRENEQLKSDKGALEDTVNKTKAKLDDAESELRNARERNSIQSMRLEGNEAMMVRKDGKIKELQDELNEVHHQNDQLTDEILRKSREIENLKMGKLMAEQELELIKNGVLPGRQSSASTRDRDSALFMYLEPATPDSGFADVEAHLKGKEREKAIEQLRKEMIKSHGKFTREPSEGMDFDKKDDAKLKAALSGQQLSDFVSENESLRRENSDMRSRLAETEKKLEEMENINNLLQRKEDEVKQKLSEQDLEDISLTLKKLEEIEQENEVLRNREREMREELQKAEMLAPKQSIGPEDVQMNLLENLESKPQVELMDLGIEDKVDENIVEDSALQLEAGGLIDFGEPSDDVIKSEPEEDMTLRFENQELLAKVQTLQQNVDDLNKWEQTLKEENESLRDRNTRLVAKLNEVEDSIEKAKLEQEKEKRRLKDNLESTNEEMQEKLRQLERDIQNSENKLKAAQDEKVELEEELGRARDGAEKSRDERKITESKVQEMERTFNEELKAKDAKIAELQKEWDRVNDDCNELKNEMRKAKEGTAHQEDTMFKAKSELADLERKVNKYNKRQEHLEKQLKQAEESECALLAELGESKSKLRRAEKELNTLQHNVQIAEDACKEKEKAKKQMEQRMAEIGVEKGNVERSLEEVQSQNKDLMQQAERAKAELAKLSAKYEELEDEKDEMQESLSDTIREKSREIRDLEADLEMSEQKYEDLKSSWNNTELVTSDLQGELMQAREEVIRAQSEVERLARMKEDLEEDLQEKENQMDHWKVLEEELRNGINEREKELEMLRCSTEEDQEKLISLNTEMESLNKSLRAATEKQKELETTAKKAEEEREQARRERQAALDSKADLESALEKSEDENLNALAKLSQAEKQINILTQKGEIARRDLEESEEAHKKTESRVRELERQLQKSMDDVSHAASKHEATDGRLLALEKELKGRGEKELALQRELEDLRHTVYDLEESERESRSRQRVLENKLAEAKAYNDQLESEREDMEYKVKDIKKKLSNERQRVEELEDELTSKKFEKDSIKQEVELLSATLSETDEQQAMGMNERENLRKELQEATKRVSELEAVGDTHHQNIEELEKLLDQKRAKVVDLEDGLKERSERITSLQTQIDEMNRSMRTLKEDNMNLEKMLEKQKQLSVGYKSGMSQRDTEIVKLTEKLDTAETSLVFMKKDLARKEGIYKAQQDELEDAEKQLASTRKKLQDMKASYEAVNEENEKLKNDLESIKRRISEMEGVQESVTVVEVDAMYTRKGSAIPGSGSADAVIKSLDDKLNHAQNKVLDLENELSKDIRRHEKDCIKTRPVSYPGKRSTFLEFDDGVLSPKYGSKREFFSDVERNSSFDDQSDTSSCYSAPTTPKRKTRLGKSKERSQSASDLLGMGSRPSFVNVAGQNDMASPQMSPVLNFDNKVAPGGSSSDKGTSESTRNAEVAAASQSKAPVNQDMVSQLEVDDKVNKDKIVSSYSINESKRNADVELTAANPAGSVNQVMVSQSIASNEDSTENTQSATAQNTGLDVGPKQGSKYVAEESGKDSECTSEANVSNRESDERILEFEHDELLRPDEVRLDVEESYESDRENTSIGRLNDLIFQLQNDDMDSFTGDIPETEASNPFIAPQKVVSPSSELTGVSSNTKVRGGNFPEAKIAWADSSQPKASGADSPHIVKPRETNTFASFTVDDTFFYPSTGSSFDIEDRPMGVSSPFDTIQPTQEAQVLHESPYDPFSTPFDFDNDDSFDAIQPMYAQGGSPKGETFQGFDDTNDSEPFIIQPPSDDLLHFGYSETADTSASSITNVTPISNPSPEQVLLRLDYLDSTHRVGGGDRHYNSTGKLDKSDNGTVVTYAFDNDIRDPGDDVTESTSAPDGEPVTILIPNEERSEKTQTEKDDVLVKGANDIKGIKAKEINFEKESAEEVDAGEATKEPFELSKTKRSRESPKTVRFDFTPTEIINDKLDIEGNDLVEEDEEKTKDDVTIQENYDHIAHAGPKFDFGGAQVKVFEGEKDDGYPQQSFRVKEFVRSAEESERERKAKDRSGICGQGSDALVKPQEENLRKAGAIKGAGPDAIKSGARSDSDDEVAVPKPSDIIKRLEGNTVGNAGFKPKPQGRPVYTGDEVLKRPEAKPRTMTSVPARVPQVKEPKSESPRSESADGNGHALMDVIHDGSPDEDRSVALGRERVMRLIAAFEGKEV
ncbi:golgin subfamily B member 1 [Nematostella vectensis]|uniref:golgin subfamily B member 1 n=1 Tax=Nematostella vectensis TaxID=45351 RepID=UPI00207740CD|nr:golgin subfamily B member 1 [Nematostella vectensis]